MKPFYPVFGKLFLWVIVIIFSTVVTIDRAASQDLCMADTSYTDVIFLIDNSQSIDDQEFDQFEDIILRTVQKVQENCQESQIGLVHYGGEFGTETFVEFDLSTDNVFMSIERAFCTSRNSAGFCAAGGGDDLNNAIGDIIRAIENGIISRIPENDFQLVIFTDAFGFETECTFINCSQILPFTNIDRLKTQFDANVTVVGASSQAESSLLAVYASPGGNFDNETLNNCEGTFDGCVTPRQYIPVEFDSPVEETSDVIAGFVECNFTVMQVVNPELGADLSVCSNLMESVTLSVSLPDNENGVMYEWDNNLPSGPSVTVSPNVTTTYTVTVTDENGCTGQDQITVLAENCLPDCSPDTSFADILFLIDNSQSIDEQEFVLFENLILNTINKVQDKCQSSQLGLVHYGGAFGSNTTIQFDLSTNNDFTAIERQFCTERNNAGFCTDGGGDDLNHAVGDLLDFLEDGSLNRNPINQLRLVIFTDAFGFEDTCTFVNCSQIRPFTNIDILKERFEARVTVVGASEQAESSLLALYASQGGTFDNVTLFQQDCAGTFDGCALPRKYIPIEFDSPVGPTSDSIVACVDCSIEILEGIVASLGEDQTICSDLDSSATLNATLLNGVEPFSYEWDNGLPPLASQEVQPAFNTTYNVTITDGIGCQDSASVTVFVEVCFPCTSPPTIECPATYITCPSTSIAPTVAGMPQATKGIEQCPDIVTTFSDDTISVQGCNVAIERTWTAGYVGFTNPALEATCVQNINVEDVTPPEIFNVPDDITVNTDQSCSAVVNWAFPNALDDCELQSISSNLPSGSTFLPGATEVVYTARDVCGNVAMDSFTVTVIEVCCTVPPMISCPIDYIGCPNTSIEPSVTGFPTGMAGDEACSALEFEFSDQTISTDDCNRVIIRTWTAFYTENIDTSLTASCEQIITLADTEAPIISGVPDNIVLDSDSTCTAQVSWTAPTSEDNCQIQSFASNIPIGSTFDAGVTNVIYSAMDACGNMAMASFTVTVNEVCCIDPPTITCPPNITICPGSSIDPSVTGFATALPGSDNCPTPDVSFEDSENGTDVNCNRVITRTWTASYGGSIDESLTASCIQTITLSDTDDPSISNLPDDIVVDSDQSCTARVNWNEPTANDNCGISSVVSNIPSGTIFDIGITSILYTATDNCGNTTSANFTVTVNEVCCIDPPTITCPPNITICPGSSIDPSVTGFATALPGSDNCPTPDVSFEDSENGTDVNCNRVITRTWTASYGGSIDESLTASCIQTITLSDTDDPSISNLPDDIVVDSDQSCTARVNWNEPTANDNCGISSVVSNIPSGTIFDIGVTSILYTATDNCGNTTSATFTVTVNEVCCRIPPTITCPPNFTGCPGDGIQPSITGNASAIRGSENCPEPEVNFSDEIVNDTSDCSLVIRRTWTASYPGLTDPALISTCVQSINLVDREAPVITGLPSEIMLASDSLCVRVVNWESPVAADNCGVADLGSDIAPGSIFNIGSTPVTYIASDFCGNTSMVSFEVIITQACCMETPLIIAPPDHFECVGTSTEPEVTGTATGIPGSDICQDPIVTFMDMVVSQGPNGQIEILRTWKATDPVIDSLMASVTQTIILNDTLPPTIIECPEDVTLDPDDPVHTWEDPIGIDNCGVILSVNIESGSTFPVGVTEVIYIATDPVGLTDTCSFFVTVPEEVMLECPEDFTVRCLKRLSLSDIPLPGINTVCEECRAENIAGFEYLGYANGSSYYISDHVDNWQEAQRAALNAGGYLVIINDQEENEFVRSLSNVNSAWIGLQDYDEEGDFRWVDGSPLTYTNWFDGQPNNFGNRQDYVEIMPNGQWNDQSNNKSLPYIIEVECVTLNTSIDSILVGEDVISYTVTYAAIDRCGTDDECTFTITADNEPILDCPEDIVVEVPYGWSRVKWEEPIYNTCCEICPIKNIRGFIFMGNLGDSYYYCSTGKSSWRSAERRAIAIGGTLAVIETEEENTYISSRLIQREAWIGLTDREREGTFEWVNGTNLSYRGWRPGEPNGSGDFVEINKNGYWFDADGSEKLEFVVEIKGCDYVEQIGGPPSGSNFRTGATTITYRATDGCGGVDTCSFDVIITTGLDEDARAKSSTLRSGEQRQAAISDRWNIDLYPNPATDAINLDLNQANLNKLQLVEVFQANGERILTFTPDKNIETIDVSKYMSGLYLIRVSDKKGESQVKKFTVR